MRNQRKKYEMIHPNSEQSSLEYEIWFCFDDTEIVGGIFSTFSQPNIYVFYLHLSCKPAMFMVLTNQTLTPMQ